MTHLLILGAPYQAEGTWVPPASPFVILPGAFKPLAFPDLRALARYVQRERHGRGLQLRRKNTNYRGSHTFTGFVLDWIGPDDTPRYAFTIAGAGEHRETLEAAIAAAGDPR